MTMFRCCAALLLAILIYGQSKAPAAQGGHLVEPKTIAPSLNQFGLKLLEAEAASKPKANVFVSPLSIYIALAMTEGGSAGTTRTAMRHTLEVPDGLTDEALHQSVGALTQSLQAQKGVELSIANAIWADPSLPLAPAFIEQCAKLYGADVRSLDFKDPGAADVMNGWVNEKTKTKIPSIVTPDLVRKATTILANAIYFMGQWRNEFDAHETADADFHLVNAATKTVKMMHHPKLAGAYRQGDRFEAAVLSYRSSNIAMFAILPAAGVAPERALSQAKTEQLINGYTPFDLELRLPRFTLDYSTELKETLKKMGMGIAFQYPGADFKPLGSPLFYIGEVIHKTRLEVDEKGTVAAAATAVVMLAGSAMPRQQEKKVLVFDRPFAVMICDMSTGAVLFEGVVYEP